MPKINSEKTCAIILCGGKGTRLGKKGLKINKTLINYMNYPLIFHIIKYLSRFNINKVIIPYGYKGLSVKKYINKKFSSKNILCFDAGINTSIIQRIKKSLKYVDSSFTNIVILNGDSYYNFDLNRLIDGKLSNNKILINLVCTKLLLNYGFIEKHKKNKKINFKYGSNSFESFQDNFGNKNYFYSGLCAVNRDYLIKNINILRENFENELFNKASKINKLGYIYDDNLFLQVNTEGDLKTLNENFK